MLNEFDCLKGIYNYESYNELINHYKNEFILYKENIKKYKEINKVGEEEFEVKIVNFLNSYDKVVNIYLENNQRIIKLCRI